MNPFILGPDRTKFFRTIHARGDERMDYGGAHPPLPSPLALRLGRLLIRMGSKLAHEDPLQYISKDLVN